MTAVAVTGLAAEAKLAVEAGLSAICGGGDPQRTASALARMHRAGITGLISFGIAGGLAPELRPGILVVADSVLAEDGTRYPTDATWAAAVRRSAVGSEGDVIGAERIVASAAEKAWLHRRTGAVAVDLESAAVARHARLAGLPFIVVRAIADPAERDLPGAACLALLPDGRPDLRAVVGSVLARPRQLPALLRTALDTHGALGSLRQALRSAAPAMAHAV